MNAPMDRRLTALRATHALIPGTHCARRVARARLLALLATLTVAVGAARAQYFALDWRDINCGAVMQASAGAFELSATIDHPISTSEQTAGNFSLVAAFWAVTASAPCGGFLPCDLNCNGSVNQFDIQPFIVLMSTHSGCSPCAGDLNADGTANLFDIQGFIECLGG